MKICFFGASVTEQSFRHDTGEVAGYVTAFESLVNPREYEVHRVSAGSSSIEDAGVVYVNKVVETGCDVCVLDWCTATSPTCTVNAILYVYKRLLENGIIPITVIFPRSDRDQVNIDVSRKTLDFCNLHNLPVLDLTHLLGRSSHGSELLRDSVHTTNRGAIVYADEILKFIRGFEFRLVSLQALAHLKLPFYVVNISTSELSEKISKFSVRVLPSSMDNIACRILLEQRVGPWSGIVGVSVNGCLSQKVSLFDPWCWRERQCVKLISDQFEISREADIRFSVLPEAPDYRVLGQRMSKEFLALARLKQIRPKGDLFVISTDPGLSVAIL